MSHVILSEYSTTIPQSCDRSSTSLIPTWCFIMWFIILSYLMMRTSNKCEKSSIHDTGCPIQHHLEQVTNKMRAMKKNICIFRQHQWGMHCSNDFCRSCVRSWKLENSHSCKCQRASVREWKTVGWDMLSSPDQPSWDHQGHQHQVFPFSTICNKDMRDEEEEEQQMCFPQPQQGMHTSNDLHCRPCIRSWQLENSHSCCRACKGLP